FWPEPAPYALWCPQDSGVYDQYTEQIPTAGGSHHSGTTGGPGTGSGPVTSGGAVSALPATRKRDGGNAATTLREVSPATRYAAPSGMLPLPDSSSSSEAGLS